MYKIDDVTIRISASDLPNHLGCRHLTQLNYGFAYEGKKPKYRTSDRLKLLQEQGQKHEQAFVDMLNANPKLSVVEIAKPANFEQEQKAIDETRTAMDSGADVVIQPVFRSSDKRYLGRPDFLIKVENESNTSKGKYEGYHYEVWDTKLASETKSGTILQLCLYSMLLKDEQGISPNYMYVVSPGKMVQESEKESRKGENAEKKQIITSSPGWQNFSVQKYRINDYDAYYRYVQKNLDKLLEDTNPGDTDLEIAEPTSACDYCDWWEKCTNEREESSHLSITAGITKLQRIELEELPEQIDTWRKLAKWKVPEGFRPKHGNRDSYIRVQEQAALQLLSEGKKKPETKILPYLDVKDAPVGVGRMPKPNPGDIFFDIEGDRFHEGGSLEYLFGWGIINSENSLEYHCHWASDRDSEKKMYESFMETILNRIDQFEKEHDSNESGKKLHIYHYGHYETSTLKQMAGRFASYTNELDDLLRDQRFVDLMTIVKQSVRVGARGYSIKNLEPLYDMVRDPQELRESTLARRKFELILQLGDFESINQDKESFQELKRDILDKIEEYNKDDVISTKKLRDYILSDIRAVLVERGELDEDYWFEAPVSEVSDKVNAYNEEISKVKEDLLGIGEIPADIGKRSNNEHALWLLINLLEFYNREDKNTWWEFHHLRMLDPEELREHKRGIAGLKFEERVGGTNACPEDKYIYEGQDADFRKDDEVRLAQNEKVIIGTVEVSDPINKTLIIKKRKVHKETHPDNVFAHNYLGKKSLVEAILECGRFVASKKNIDAPGKFRATRDILLQKRPRMKNGLTLPDLSVKGEKILDTAINVMNGLDGGALAIQGPPGAGKSYIASKMVLDLIRQQKSGKSITIGITALGHKAILNLLAGIEEQLAKEGLSDGQTQLFLYKVSDMNVERPPYIEKVKKASDLKEKYDEGNHMLVAGTNFFFSNEIMEGAIDYLFIDEAGQYSLADTIAAGRAAKNIILLGDPSQLERPLQGSHPDGTDLSALEHLLVNRNGENHKTLPTDVGFFLDQSWRIHPDISKFISDLYYESRLDSVPGCINQKVSGVDDEVSGSGLRLLEVNHIGNDSYSKEEVLKVKELYDKLLVKGAKWSQRSGHKRSSMDVVEKDITEKDILIVAPYNRQVHALQQELGPNARVGTVDKFQGQEAAVVIYSMTTSSPEDAPRGMEFLYSGNRLNVAVSRAKCLAIVVASPELFEPDCKTPRQMQLVNSFCLLREKSKVVGK
jgi:predicted RecB family nuclease